MIFEGMEANRDSNNNNNDYYATPNLRVEKKQEVKYLQSLFMLEQDVSIVSVSAKNVLDKYSADILEMLKDKYPEDVIGEEFGKFKEYIDTCVEVK